MRLRTTVGVWLVALGAAPVAAQVAAPPKPEQYHADIRYRIIADRDGRVRIHRAMMAELAALGFVPDAREDADLDKLDAGAEFLPGTIQSAKADQLSGVLAVQTVLLIPVGTTLPEDGAKPVQVSLTIAAGLDLQNQRILHEQVLGQLAKLGFREGVAYDHRGFSRVRGAISAGKVLLLLKDLRNQPAGWLLAATPRSQLPLPIRSLVPVRAIEVLPDLEAVAPAAALPAAPSPKYTADLRLALANPAAAGKPIRVELALNYAPIDLRSLRAGIRAAVPGAALEGVLGSIISVYAPTPADVEKLIQLPGVLSARTPRTATETVTSAGSKTNEPPAGVLAGTNIHDLHITGYRGAGKHIVIVASAFNGVDALINNGLPAGTRIIDLTGELTPTLESNPASAGHGAQAAIAAAAAAPEAALLLVRVDPSAFHQLLTVGKAVLGDTALSPALVSRSEELIAENETLERRRAVIAEEYRQAFNNLSDDERPAARRKTAQDAVARLRTEDAAFRTRYERLVYLRSGIEALAGASVIVNTLVWDDGYPADGLSEVSRFIDEKMAPPSSRSALKAARLKPVPVWVQAAGDMTGSVWTGPFLDRDGNRVMEFGPAADRASIKWETGATQPWLSWTPELNFLALNVGDGKTSDELPAGAKFRIAIQWREPHEPEMVLPSEPLFGFTLRLLKQLDPTGRKAAEDEMVEVARSEGPAVRLLKTNSSGVYEQTLQATLPAAGRYALRVEGELRVPPQFAGSSRMPAVAPRIIIRPADAASAGFGRIQFGTYHPESVGVGAAADAENAFTVGAADATGQSTGLQGAGPGLQLRMKPDVLLPGRFSLNNKLAAGSGIAAGYAAGLAASLADTGVRPRNLTRGIGIVPGQMLVLPASWLATLPPVVRN